MNSGGPWLPGEKAVLEAAAAGAAGIESGPARCGPRAGWVQIHHDPLCPSLLNLCHHGSSLMWPVHYPRASPAGLRATSGW